jgi:hypothetical protein
MALNLGTKSTTVRVVFNSYRGCSLNLFFTALKETANIGDSRIKFPVISIKILALAYSSNIFIFRFRLKGQLRAAHFE